VRAAGEVGWVVSRRAEGSASAVCSVVWGFVTDGSVAWPFRVHGRAEGSQRLLGGGEAGRAVFPDHARRRSSVGYTSWLRTTP